MRLQHIRKWPPAWKTFLSASCCKNESEIGFLTVTSSWGYQHDFSTETSQFLSSTTHFYDCAVNNLINFEVIETIEQHFIYFKFHSTFFEFLTWRIVKSYVSNLSLPRRFSMIQVRGKVGKLVH